MQALLWTMLLVAALGAHPSLHVCTGTCCGEAAATAGADEPATEPADACCCCREAGHAAGADDADRGRHRAQAEYDSCCVDLQLQVEPAPLPRRVAVDAGPEPAIAAVPALPPSHFLLPACAPEPGTPATGPPRRDRRTLLLSTTVLRL